MNRVLKLGAAALLAVGLTVPAVAFARITLDVQPADESVIFFHNRHTALACTTCHAAKPDATPPSLPIRATLPTSCQNCHDLTCGDEPATNGCVNCHSDISPLPEK